MKSNIKIIIRLLLVTVGLLLMLDTFILIPIVNVNAGIILPAVLGLPLLLVGLFYNFCMARSKKGFGKVVRIVIITGYVAFILSFCIVSSVVVSKSRMSPKQGADVVIILGAGIRGESLTAVLKDRIDVAAEYLNDNPHTIAVASGGQGPGESIPEAVAIQRELIRLGISEDRIIVESESRNTYQNFEYSKILLDERFGEDNYTAVFATTDFHVFRSGMIAKDAGIPAQGIGVASLWYLIPNFYLREYLSLIKYGLLKIV
ncbi:MAG: YdcF family protein [Clostridiales bacterium]|jgi:uncharacterized SAM-binding protein YcdF (DUF218 family)|nr:YdcF family protein [Clostridiales bacterium]